jgi:hypothetical protein
MLHEEEIARQRSPLDNEIFAQLRNTAKASNCDYSVHNLLFNTVALGCYIGPRLSEYAQTIQDKVDYHTYLSGHQVIKAFITNDYVLYDKCRQVIKTLTMDSFDQAYFVQVTWQIQKNRQNGQAITLAADIDHPKICPVRSALRIVLRTQRLGQPSNLPIAMYKSKQGKTLYLTGTKIAELLRAAVRAIRPDTTKEELKRYSAHSLRIWVCVLLDEASKSPEYIKKRLRWLGDSFRMYLRDTSFIQHQHVDALRAALQEVLDLIAALPADVIALSTLTDGTTDPDMSEYADKID